MISGTGNVTPIGTQTYESGDCRDKLHHAEAVAPILTFALYATQYLYNYRRNCFMHIVRLYLENRIKVETLSAELSLDLIVPPGSAVPPLWDTPLTVAYDANMDTERAMRDTQAEVDRWRGVPLSEVTRAISEDHPQAMFSDALIRVHDNTGKETSVPITRILIKIYKLCVEYEKDRATAKVELVNYLLTKLIRGALETFAKPIKHDSAAAGANGATNPFERYPEYPE